MERGRGKLSPAWKTRVRPGVEQTVYLPIENLFRCCQLVPGLPERFHFIRLAQRNSCICVHRRERAADSYVVLPEMIDHRSDLSLGIEHHEICPGGNHLQLTCCCLALELVTIKAIPHHGSLMFIFMLK